MASSEAVRNELIRVLWESLSKQECTLFLKGDKGEQANRFRLQRWRGYGWSSQLRILCTRSNPFQRIILGILTSQENERTQFFMSCIPVDFPVQTSPRWIAE